ncbi:hypothetical protein BCT27_15715 [Enterovibrio norvegicus]|uniref:Prepilin type IV endopeptidase peptidase domain-containing protein n=2 Tax=Enterovibrio norvegicus TaxID=188144 RepID=A0A2N7L861_9GAMM|nr:hypothetical protein BCT27_15715 [Enterovibrio norvegicus]PMN90284.1 hypothetical protein BCT23_20885 [Enterovibrio norvegicus]
MATDITKRTISNSLCLFVLMTCIALALFDSSLQIHMYQFTSVVVIGLGLFAMGVLGAGDTKLLAAYSLIIDEEYFLFTLFIITVLGALIALFILAMQLASKNKYRRGVPYGVPIVVASLFSIYLSKLN